MRPNKLPHGWNEERVQRVLAHYEGQTDEEAAAEDESALEIHPHPGIIFADSAKTRNKKNVIPHHKKDAVRRNKRDEDISG